MSLQPFLVAMTNTVTGGGGGTTVGYRPTSGTGYSVFPLGVDIPAIPTDIDSNTYTYRNSSISSLVYTFTGFGTGTKTGTVNIRATVTTNFMDADPFFAESSCSMSFSYTGSGGEQYLINAAGGIGDVDYLTPVTSGTLSGIDLSTLVVTLVLHGERSGDIHGEFALAAATISLYDIVFLGN